MEAIETKSDLDAGIQQTVEEKEDKLIRKATEMVAGLSPLETMISDAEIRAFGFDGARLVNLALWKIRNGNGPVFELPLADTERVLSIGRRGQENAIKALTEIGVFIPLKGGAKNVKRFEFKYDGYIRAIENAGYETMGLADFRNKFDDAELARYNRARLTTRAQELVNQCEGQMGELQKLLRKLSDVMNELERA